MDPADCHTELWGLHSSHSGWRPILGYISSPLALPGTHSVDMDRSTTVCGDEDAVLLSCYSSYIYGYLHVTCHESDHRGSSGHLHMPFKLRLVESLDRETSGYLESFRLGHNEVEDEEH